MPRPEPFDWTLESPRVSTAPADDPWALDYADLEGEPLHLRNYAVRSYRLGRDRFLIRGVVDDRKHASSWLPDDGSMMVMHHMVLDLLVEFPTLVILEAKMVMEAHPHEVCIEIEDKYEQLQGVSIARGFTHKVREMFGGPRGCTHATALLQAMAPVAVQTTWGMMMANRLDDAIERGEDTKPAMLMPLAEDRAESVARSLNTCHVWDEQGPVVAHLLGGGTIELPLPLRRRMARREAAPDS